MIKMKAAISMSYFQVKLLLEKKGGLLCH